MHETNVTIQTIAQFLDERAWWYVMCGHARIETGFRGEYGVFPITIALLEDQPNTLVVLVRTPFVVPENRRLQMAEAIVRASYGMKMGAFTMDMSFGIVVFVVAMPVAGGNVAKEQFDDLLSAGMYAADRYFRAFARLLYGDDLSPAEVIAEVEMATIQRQE